MRCGNPVCKAEAMYLRSGSLYYIDAQRTAVDSERASEQKQLIWLCAECCKHYRVETWRPAGQQLQHWDEPTARKSVLNYPVTKTAAA